MSEEFWKYLAAIGAFLTALWAHIHARINKLIDTAREDAKGESERRDRLWDALEQHIREDHEFQKKILSDYPTKADLNAMEARLTKAINGGVKP